jgi:probable poly-beta-1,6-N-acetyl-D-glucosamine export protein
MNFKFVDLIRFFSMASIVYNHSLGAFLTLNNASIDINDAWVVALMKFGPICFYLISGFLLGEKIITTPSLTYLKRRFDSTFRPYLRTVLIFVPVCSIGYFFGANKVHSLQEYGYHIIKDFIYTVLYTNYWFIINFFISLSIILVFKRYLFTYTFFFLLLSIAIIYSINIYVEYFDPRHTVALFGFLFYLWLGIFINKYKKEVIQYIDKIQLRVFLILGALLMALTIYEAHVLEALNSIDPYNALKISNQLYSLLIFFFFIKIRDWELPRVFNPKKDTYGIYLYHPFTLLFLPKALVLLGYTPIPYSSYFLFVFFVGYIIVYLLTLMAVKCINNPPSQWSAEFRILLRLQKV